MMAALGADPAAEPSARLPSECDPAGGPEVLGDFELVRELGRGGMGIVYEARQLSLGCRRVALKILSAAAALDPRQMRRFQVEVQAAACLDHEHVVPVYSVGHERGVPFYVMRLIEGRSLAQIIRELRRGEAHQIADEETGDWLAPDAIATTLANDLASGRLSSEVDGAGQGKSIAGGMSQTLSPEARPRSLENAPTEDATTSSSAKGSSTCDRAYFRTVARLGVQAAEALDYAHREGILHRDVKPANLLVDLRGDLWITDFGLARLRGGSELTRTGDLIGTLRYMSPEQALARRVPIDHRTDVYSLGVTIYEMLTLRPAFGGNDRTQILRRIAEEEPRPPRRLNRRISRDLETVVLKAMAKEPARRYQSAGELAADLGRFLEGLPVRARRIPLWRRSVAWVKTHRTTAILMASGLVVALSIGSVWSFLQRKESEFLARRFESATVADLAEMLPRLNMKDPAIVACLDRQYAGEDPEKKLAAALVLAPTRAGCEDYVLDRFLDADPRLLGLLIPLLRRQIPGPFIARLESEVRGKPIAGLVAGEAELRDRRRANAACGLIALGNDGPAWQLLRSVPDPQARSFLVATLGPAGVGPDRLVAHLDDPRLSSSARSALIQSLGDVPKTSWPPDLHAGVVRRLLAIYRDEPDAAVHAAAKWLLFRWGFGAAAQRINSELAKEQRSDPRFRWRISREGLTLISVDDPALDWEIEVSDSEITVELFRRFDQNVSYSLEISPQESCPVNAVSYYDAAAFCNWLGSREGLPEEEACYRSAGMDNEYHHIAFQPAVSHRNRAGFRLPTSDEFAVFCAAGTSTRRYHGDSDSLFSRYAWTLMNSDGRAHPVASLLPNDLGLFDTLGSISEWCERTQPQEFPQRVVADKRGGFYSFSPPSNLDRFAAHQGVPGGWRDPTQGFRVVRTKKLRQKP
jgi:serine/threonine protein kinase